MYRFEYHGIVSKTVERTLCKRVGSRFYLTGGTGIHIECLHNKRKINVQSTRFTHDLECRFVGRYILYIVCNIELSKILDGTFFKVVYLSLSSGRDFQLQKGIAFWIGNDLLLGCRQVLLKRDLYLFGARFQRFRKVVLGHCREEKRFFK